jgi:hypothetical protein
MLRVASQNGDDPMETGIAERFVEIDTSDFPDFYEWKKPLEMGLWVLWVAKEKLATKKLTAEHIASVIRDVKETSIDGNSITQAFHRAGDKVHTYEENGETYYEIMRPGKERLISRASEGSVGILYFEPGERYTSKRLLSKKVLANLEGELSIVDPYCGQRTLDILKDIKGRRIRFLTRIENIKKKDRSRFLRDVRDLRSECPNVEFRSYPNTDIHDRYIISSKSLVILGHSIKDLGGKESLAIVLSKDSSKNVVEALTESFNRRWSQSSGL